MCSACCDPLGRPEGISVYFGAVGLSKGRDAVLRQPRISVSRVSTVKVFSRPQETLTVTPAWRVLSSGLHYTIAKPKLCVSLHPPYKAKLYEEILLLFGFLWFCLIINH